MKPYIRKSNRFRAGGGALLETVLVLPVLLSLSFGCIEYAHFFYIKHMMQAAAREGCRAAIVSTGTKAEVDTAISNCLSSGNLTNTTTTIKRNGTTVTTLTAAVTGDTILVQVECNWGTVGIRPMSLISSSKQVVGATTMRRE